MAEFAETTKAPRKNNGALSSTLPLSDVFFMTLKHWQWILLSVIVFVGGAYLYLLRTPNVYTRAAEIIIKEDSKTESIAQIGMGLTPTNTNLQNEMINLRSYDLMVEVVRRLSLDMNYFIPSRFHDIVAYGYGLPLELTVADFPEDERFSCDIEVDKGGKVYISNLLTNEGTTVQQTFKGQLNDSIETPIGKMVVKPLSAYKKGDDCELHVNKIPVGAAAGLYRGRLGVAVSNEKASVIRLTMSDQSVQRADDVLSTLIGVYNENWIRDKNQIAVSTSNFINDRLGIIEAELGSVDSDISSYKSQTLVPNFEAAASMYFSQNQQTQAAITEVNNQLSMARYVRSYLTAEFSKNQILPANTGLQSSSVQSLIGQYNQQMLQRNALIAKSSEKNPLVAQLDEELEAQRQAMINTIDNEIVALNAQLKSLRTTEAQTTSRIASNPKQAQNLLSVERQQKVKEALYLFLLQKREENELSQAFTAYNTRIVSQPGPSGVPVVPNRKNILLMAFLVGLALPFGVTFLKEMNNTKVRGRKDLEHLIVPFAGEIPQYVSKSTKKNGEDDDAKTLVVKAGKRNVINEAFRVLRTNVEFMCNSIEGAKIIALTSFNPGSGKSFISINLGMSIALKGKKVLVIDGDMRHGSTSAYVESPESGLSDYLSGGDDNVQSLLVKYESSDSLYVLPIGSMPPNPTELLETSRFSEMLDSLKTQFDYIIIDCPPIEVVADAQIIDQYVDRTFFIVRAGLLERSMVPELDRLYDEKKYKNIAYILNGTKNDQSRYGYSHTYRYGYGYGYGYGYNYSSDDKKRSKKK